MSTDPAVQSDRRRSGEMQLAEGTLMVSEPRVTYYAKLYDGDTRDDPAGIVRRTHTDPPVDEAFQRDMTGHPTEYLRRHHLRGTSDTERVQNSAESATAVVERWCAEWAQPG